ncbi:hypothetical protein Lfu02_67690 [Longispora fulva]|uniref:Uncharacterized protein n=1 Tax=Longispora fulva TaxID=619741 RepID=A0A8J7KXY5_9ACTN|nr:DUF6343 family protein [Longispora fulva]MBG6138497.1 hypothetical protein [Longispora fulva]GIG62397.1 hypothetical protein Lfu02_67690 [Longispora fulva]
MSGTFQHPRSALRLRAVLAGFGLLFCAVIGTLAWRAGLAWLAVPLFVLAGVAAVDLVVIRHHHTHPRW